MRAWCRHTRGFQRVTHHTPHTPHRCLSSRVLLSLRAPFFVWTSAAGHGWRRLWERCEAAQRATAAKCLAARAAQRRDGGGRSPAPQRAARCGARDVLSPTGTDDGHRGRGARAEQRSKEPETTSPRGAPWRLEGARGAGVACGAAAPRL